MGSGSRYISLFVKYFLLWLVAIIAVIVIEMGVFGYMVCIISRGLFPVNSASGSPGLGFAAFLLAFFILFHLFPGMNGPFFFSCSSNVYDTIILLNHRFTCNITVSSRYRYSQVTNFITNFTKTMI